MFLDNYKKELLWFWVMQYHYAIVNWFVLWDVYDDYIFVKDVKHKMGESLVCLWPQSQKKCSCHISMYSESCLRIFSSSLPVCIFNAYTDWSLQPLSCTLDCQTRHQSSLQVYFSQSPGGTV